jgi:hypothetical protein
VSEIPHDHARPSIADQRAALTACRALVIGADADAHEAADAGGSCAACVALAGISYVCTVVSTLLGDEMFLSERTRSVILAAIDGTEDELRSAGN